MLSNHSYSFFEKSCMIAFVLKSLRMYLLYMCIILIFILSINIFFAEAKLYHFDNTSGDVDSTWRYNTELRWISSPTDSYLSNGKSLISGNLGCGQQASISKDVMGPCFVSFAWRKIGKDAKLKLLKNDSEIGLECKKSTWTPVPPFFLESGLHNLTWDFKVASCNDEAGSEGYLDYVLIDFLDPEQDDSALIESDYSQQNGHIILTNADNIQEAISCGDGKILELENGTYYNKNVLDISVSNITLMSKEPLGAIIDGKGDYSSIEIYNKSNVTIEGLLIINSSNGIVLEECRDFSIKGNIIKFNNGGFL